MSKELIISANAHEKKIAILENGIVTEFYVERSNDNQGIVGNIYKGQVMKVLPGMQSAFVDIGLERDAFLYVSDFFAEDDNIEGAILEGRSEAEQRERERERNEQRDRQREQRRVAQLEAEAAASVIESDASLSGDLVDDGESGDEESGADNETMGFTAADIEETRINAFIAAPTDEERERELLERVNDDEVPEEIEDAVVEPVDARSRRPRRRGRRDEVVAAPAEAAEEEVVEIVDVVEPEAEVAVEPARRGRRGKGVDPRGPRSGPRRKAAGPAEPDVVEEVEGVVVGSLLSSLADSSNPFERVTDEDLAPSERASRAKLPDTEEFPVPTVEKEIEPAPDVPVGSLSFEADPSLERVVDESAEATASSAPMTAIGDVLSDVVSGIHVEESPAEGPEAASEQSLAIDPDALLEPQTVDGQEEKFNLEDSEASVREPKHEEKFARRSGRRPRPTGGGNGGGGRPAGPRGPDSRPGRDEGGDGRSGQPTIADLLREGQEIIVQIAKEPIASKGARITSHVALPGRFLVYMPTVDHVGVSRKIPSDDERLRLKRLMQQLKREENAPGGFIVRTAGEGHTDEEIRDDMLYLLRTATDIKKSADKVKSPAVVHRDLDLVQRILRDQLSSDFTAIRVDNEVEYTRIVEFINRVQPKFVRRVKLHTRNTPIFEEFGVQEEIDKALKPRVWLKSGGYIVINQTEALVAIDVNTGKFVGKSNRLEDTIVKTNLDAVKEIVRQIRLRDLGGIIILDLIDMEERKNRHRVMEALQEELKQDRSPSKVLQFNEFGLVAITRKRVRQSLERTLGSPCPYCAGSGLVKSAQTVCYEILADAKRIAVEVDTAADVTLRVSPEVAKALRGPEIHIFHEIEDYIGVPVTIKDDPNVHQEQFDFAIV